LTLFTAAAVQMLMPVIALINLAAAGEFLVAKRIRRVCA